MSVLIRTGSGITDVEWTDNLVNGNEVFIDTKDWITYQSGHNYNCLQRIGDMPNEVDYINTSEITNQDDLASLCNDTEFVKFGADNGTNEIMINCVPSGFMENTLDLVENGNENLSTTRKGFFIDFVFSKDNPVYQIDAKLIEIKLKMITTIKIDFNDGTYLEVPTIDTNLKDNVVEVYHSDSWTKYDEWFTKPQIPVKITFI